MKSRYYYYTTIGIQFIIDTSIGIQFTKASLKETLILLPQIKSRLDQ